MINTLYIKIAHNVLKVEKLHLFVTLF